VEEVRKMNEHIELVKKWLADKDSVSLGELKDSANAADEEYHRTIGHAALVLRNAREDEVIRQHVLQTTQDDYAARATRAAVEGSADSEISFLINRYEELANDK